MKLSEKAIKKEFFAAGTQLGELKPVIYKNGELFVPTSRGLKAKSEYSTKKKAKK